MVRLSFFKLPLIFAVLFVLFDNLLFVGNIVISMMDRAEGYSDLWLYLLTLIPEQLYYSILKGTFCIAISAIALYRINVHIVTSKNIILLAINAFICVAVLYAISYGINNVLLVYYNSTDYRYQTPNLFNLFMQPILILLVRYLITYVVVGLLINYLIKLVSEQYQKARIPFELTHNNSQKIHVLLFLSLFFFVYSVISSTLVSFVYSIMHEHHQLIMGTFLLYLMICTVAVFWKTKNNFTQQFVLLQSDRIVKSVSLINFSLFIFNIIYAIICFYCTVMVMTAVDQRSPGTGMIIFCVLAVLIQIAFICLLSHVITKRYFGRVAINGTI